MKKLICTEIQIMQINFTSFLSSHMCQVDDFHVFFSSQNVALFATVCLEVVGGSFSEKLPSLAELILIFLAK